MSRMRGSILLVLVGLVLSHFFTPAAAPEPGCESRINDTPEKLMECVTLEGVRGHQAALQMIADAHGGTRVSGMAGHEAAVAYVVDRLSEAGYLVTVQPFRYQAFIRLASPRLEQAVPRSVRYTVYQDMDVLAHSDAGDVTAAVAAVDLQLGPDNRSTSGCQADDFAGFPAGAIALVQRGTCGLRTKAEAAAAAGAVGLIIFNQGDSPSHMGLFGGSLSPANAGGIPVLEATYARGVEWASTPGLVLHMAVDVYRGPVTSYNVLAETRKGRADRVVMAGAHLDSLDFSPGGNDNGSGSAALLEVALQMKGARPENKVRFAWWGAEEAGLAGSDYYVRSLGAAERANIALYLNLDMIASPNYGRFVFDGDGSAFGRAAPPGSAAIEALFGEFYRQRGLAFEPARLDFRSDYTAFYRAGIPVGGLFTGSTELKTAEQVALYGGTAGRPFDACYHWWCDTLSNVNLEVLDLNADAIACGVATFARSTAADGGC